MLRFCREKNANKQELKVPPWGLRDDDNEGVKSNREEPNDEEVKETLASAGPRKEKISANRKRQVGEQDVDRKSHIPTGQQGRQREPSRDKED